MRKRLSAWVLLIAALAAFPAAAQAQGFFDFFRRGPSMPYSARGFADPFDFNNTTRERPATSGPAVAYCVRLCDGRFFPIQRQRGVEPSQTCNTMCPAAETRIFSGSVIDHAVSRDGRRYADLPNAFHYRDKIAADCTCNGYDPLGIARVDTNSDPTLRAGDIVATDAGMMAYKGDKRGQQQYTPVNRLAVSAEMRRRLSQMKVVPQADGEMQAATDAPAEEGTTGARPQGEREPQR